MDIAMVRLGIQYRYGGRSEYENWENPEQEMLNQMDLGAGFANIKEPQQALTAGNTVYAIHYGGDDNSRKIVELTVAAVINATPIPTIKLQPINVIQPGASGCPIIISEDYKLVGLFFGARVVEPTVGFALMCNSVSGIKKFITDGVSIIAEIGSYMALKNLTATDHDQETNSRIQQRKSQGRESLQEKANNLQLTIYLMDGEKFYGQN
jgi:hypothetical protein